MIDFIKAKTKIIDAKVCENSEHIYIDSIQKQKVKNGFSTTLTYKFGAMQIRITEANTYLEGSLHKMYNEIYKRESQNYDDFDFEKLCEVVAYICKNLKIKPNQLIIQNLEFGINIRTKQAPAKILSAHTIHYKNKPVSINLDEIAHESAKYYRWQMTEHWIKVYDKGLHFKQRQKILRLEKKITKSRSIHRLGIVTMSDLLAENLFSKLFKSLINVWNQICVVDYLQGTAGMTYDQRNLFLIMVNPKTYEAYQNSPKTDRQRKAMQRLRFKFSHLNDSYKFDSIHKEILESIKTKASKMSQNHQYM